MGRYITQTPVIITDKNCNSVVLEDNGGLPVNIQDQTSEIVDLHLSEFLSSLTLTVNTALDEISITGDVDAAFLPVIGDIVCLKEDAAFYQGEVLSVTANGGDNYTLGLDTPLDYPFTTAGGCSVRNQDLSVDGSVAPVVFTVSPEGLTVRWDIVRVMYAIATPNNPDALKFGGITGGLARGVVLRMLNGTRKNIFNAKTNGDLAAHSYDLTYDDRAGGGGTYFVRMRRTFGGQNKNGVVIRLTGDQTIQVIVQDDLTLLTDYQCVVQGHVVEGL